MLNLFPAHQVSWTADISSCPDILFDLPALPNPPSTWPRDQNGRTLSDAHV
ncbi:hypothetical protein HD598_000833 [Neomicrococcus aestuarii]|uniref:Uncharacterized protein n=1 Tax=Neomicrococcus aestuarii TaxID=556325 RepID=A0A7W8TV90_9MICC|nr:hypothetical protein [Neomicrococcus aestuarii]